MNSTTTDFFGEFSIMVPTGNQTLTFEKVGYEFTNVSVTVTQGQVIELHPNRIVGNPTLTSGDHIYFANSEPASAGANLDVDDTDSYGPETITITELQSGTYVYYVHQWSVLGSLTSSDAEVRVFGSDGVIETITIPSSGTGSYWYVARLSGTTLMVVNTLMSSEPTNYETQTNQEAPSGAARAS